MVDGSIMVEVYIMGAYIMEGYIMEGYIMEDSVMGVHLPLVDPTIHTVVKQYSVVMGNAVPHSCQLVSASPSL